ncbi:hypothetical protein CPB84DRAFT_1853471 [Gymnopilus junonius]|uniref:CxC2-like cysteine cluster KDZ transposase-associated domain-containing protein n=1 Tax=Gymnopilus junonius TaxID=109634 RepID=A0A9P5NAP4_GYMJU|nr:hypothetical protein CPB84DRAFT_1853471 [Gymnopilus junonius]
MSSDGHFYSRSRFTSVPGITPTPSASTSQGQGNIASVSDNSNDFSINDWADLPGDPYEPESTSTKKRRSERPPMDWVQDREQFLSEILRLEGREVVPFPRLFERVSLMSLGHRVHLGHPAGEKCPAPSSAYGGKFTVLDLNGVHSLDVSFCDCERKHPHFIQLLRFGWFPATVKFPRTAVTFRLLRFYQILSFESKAMVFEFHKTLSRLTDNTGTRIPKNRYTALLRVVRESSHLSMLKRSGRGHHLQGAAGTQRGELALLCPACPQVGINLPSGWEYTPKAKRFLYGLFIGLDANFRLKRKIVSSHAADPGLSQGWAYFVQEDEFKNFLHKYGKLIVQEPSKCSNHDAVNRERAMEGYAASGIATCDCTRHDMKRPNGVCDIQKGERYLNMDFIFLLSLLIRITVLYITVSYDIACQWSIYFWDRMKIYPEFLQLLPALYFIQFLIPKFHLPAHILLCQIIFSLNYNKDCGRTDGEGVERGWDYINPIATSTREMGPGSHHDTLDAHFGDWNWQKTCSMSTFLLRQIKEAILELEEKLRIHEEFTHNLSEEDVAEWMMMVEAWENDHLKPNPFEVMLKEVSASQLITMGLELENQQRRLGVDADLLGIHATDDQKTKLMLRSNTLKRKIEAWIEIQHMYIPSLHLFRSRAADMRDSPTETPPQDIPLLLPSSIPGDIPCDYRLKHIEWRLRYAQCGDSLDDLRDALCLRSFILIDKSRFQRGQRQILGLRVLWSASKPRLQQQ